MGALDLFDEASRQLTICNACRYCEGFCPVFRAIEIRRVFKPDDVRYLANLCHDCRACYQACMFTPPHEFAINLPKLMSEARMESYQHWSWPKFLARSFPETARGALLGCAAAAIVYLLAILLISSGRLLERHVGPGSLYQIVPYTAMVVPALILFLYGAAIWFQGGVRFWTDSDSPLLRARSGLAPVFRAAGDAFSLKYLGGGGPGCSYPEEAPSSSRRIFHSFVFWGFLLDFASTTCAFIYQDFRHMLPPYPVLSAPVILGTVGGVGLVIGTAGLLWIKASSDRALSAESAYGLDYTFLAFLGLAGFTGLLTLIFRTTPALGPLLVLHLGTVAALFITAPYGKFVHFIYRSFALIRYRIEEGGARAAGGNT
jgi:citrate/tricarballylate utilization protein